MQPTTSTSTESFRTRGVRLRTEQVLREAVRGTRAWRRARVRGELGSLPDFLILGAMRCGTTSLYQYLAQHPDVAPALGKELQFFSVFYGRGERWYRGHFPPARPAQLTFEASPYYLYHPLVPERVAQALPEARFIVLLRDPVERAYSHYMHTRERGVEPLSFADAIRAEKERLEPYVAERADSKQAHAALRRYSYVSRGFYADQLERWFEHVAPERVHVIRSESLYADPQAHYDECLAFLGLRGFTLDHFGRHTRAKPVVASQLDAVRDELSQTFAPHNERLRALLGWRESWPAQNSGASSTL